MVTLAAEAEVGAAGVEVAAVSSVLREMIRMQTKKCMVGFSSFLIEKIPLTFTASRGCHESFNQMFFPVLCIICFAGM